MKITRYLLFLLGVALLSGTNVFPMRADAQVSVPSLAPPASLRRTGVGPLAQGTARNKLTTSQALALLQTEHDRYWANAKRILYRDVQELNAQHGVEVARGRRHRKFLHGPQVLVNGRKLIALTFDDGPHPAFTPGLLAVLKREKVRATFFVVGQMAERYPDLIQQQVAGGHSIGNHTYHHVSLVKIPQEDAAAEVKTCGLVLQQLTGKPMHLFRPPGGQYDREVADVSDLLGYTMVLWTDDPGDYSSPGEEVIYQRTVERATAGGIILLHDGVRQTINVLPRILRTLKAQGYSFVTVDELMAASRLGNQPLPGAVASVPAARPPLQ